MRIDAGWKTAQMPSLVSISPSQKPTYVDPALRAQEADALRADVEAFLRNGGQIERVLTSRSIKRNGRGA